MKSTKKGEKLKYPRKAKINKCDIPKMLLL